MCVNFCLFSGRVLGRKPGEYQLGELKFEVAFNLCLVWLIVFVCLSRGPKTFGKVSDISSLLKTKRMFRIKLIKLMLSINLYNNDAN